MKNLLLVISFYFFAFGFSFGQNNMDSITESAPPVKPTLVEVVCFCDVEATFPGGDYAMTNWIQRNIRFPDFQFSSPAEGKVYVTFIVERDGSITLEHIAGIKNESLREEAKRVVLAMPKWHPGEFENKRVRTRCRIPIEFELI